MRLSLRWGYPRGMQRCWHRWYAWHPVRIYDQLVIGEYVQRRRIGPFSLSSWEYRTIQPTPEC